MARILIVDDEADIRQLVTYALVEDAHDVATAADGTEAMEQVTENPPDLVILDVMMPGLDGFDLLAKLEEKGLRGDTRVLILTARGSERDWKQGYDLGADRYMTKPFDPEDLITTVRELMSATPEELAAKREEEQDRSNLLAQLETIFDDR